MPRLRRWARKLGLVLLELVVVLTVLSVVYNVATRDRVKPASPAAVESVGTVIAVFPPKKFARTATPPELVPISPDG